jgi:hypothetical protein
MFVSGNSASIGFDAFYNCVKLREIFILDDAAAIPGGQCSKAAFARCSESGTIYYSGSALGLVANFKNMFLALSN